MHKFLIFDLDGTLAPIGKGMSESDIGKLKLLEKSGYRIAVCSGKPTYYLCGFMRQIGLENPIFIGENGATVQYGVDLPPKKFLVHPHTENAKKQLADIKTKIEKVCNGIWFQPNEVAVTPFPSKEEDFETIQAILDDSAEELTELFVYNQCDCFDITPKNISKASGLELLKNGENLNNCDFIAIGDGVNDIPMFEFADVSLCIGDKLDFPADYRFTTIGEALNYIIHNKL